MNFRNWLPSTTRSEPKRTPRSRLAIERLEDRTVPSASISVANASLDEVGGTTNLVASGSGGLSAPKDLTRGPDGNIYVASTSTNSVLRYHGTTGQLLGTFVATNSGGLTAPFGLAFGPDGNLYVGSEATDAIYRYSGTTGAFLNAFVPSGTGGLDVPKGIVFGQDGNLYVSSRDTASILRFQGPGGPAPGSPLPAPGQSGATFVPTASGGLYQPHDLIFGPDGNLDVSGDHLGVLKFDGATGSFIGTLIPVGVGGLANPRGLAFDQDGRLYVADIDANAIHRFDSQGQFLDDVVSGASATLIAPVGMIFDPLGSLLVSNRDANAVARCDRGVLVSLSAASSTPVSVDYGTLDGSASSGGDYSAQTGTVSFAPGQTSRRILLATKDDPNFEGNEMFSIQLSNAVGDATISNGSATVTIVDDEAARQINIGDASALEGDHAAHYRGTFVQIQPGKNFNDQTFGPDGLLYASPGPSAGPIDRYDSTGAFVDHFIPAGRINGARDIVFRDGFVYVGSEGTDEVLRFDATTGAFDRAFVTGNPSILDGPQGLTFGPDTNADGIPELYVTGRNSFNVVRYDGATGQPLGSFATTGAGALSWPEGLTIGSGGIAYVASTGSNLIQKYNAVTGAYLGIAASAGLSGPKDVKFGPDGLMYVASSGNDRIMRFTPTGTYVDDYVPAGSGGMDDTRRLAFGPDGDLYATALGTNQILRFGTEPEAVFTASLSTTSSFPVTVDYQTLNGTAVAGNDYSSTSGTLVFPAGVSTRTIHVSTLDDSVIEPAKTFTVNLSNASGAVVADGSGTATILDNDTKFYVINDSGTNQTFEYGSTGSAGESTALSSGNTAPRGAASNADGSIVWVLDANKTIYVYNASGGLLGSWLAPGSASVQLEGIATNGTDIWLLENSTDNVYKYAGAASRLSGSQGWSTSFKLNNANTNGKGIVTDGTSLWVVDDGTSSDKIYKYTISGSLKGSWTIDAADSHPTGLTIDPSNVSDIWTVDSGTKKVYQYTAAAGRTSGSQSAAATFALAAGNTNPQDIADPPVSGALPIPASVANLPSHQFETTAIAPAQPTLSLATVAIGLVTQNSRPLSPSSTSSDHTEQVLAGVDDATWFLSKSGGTKDKSTDTTTFKSLYFEGIDWLTGGL